MLTCTDLNDSKPPGNDLLNREQAPSSNSNNSYREDQNDSQSSSSRSEERDHELPILPALTYQPLTPISNENQASISEPDTSSFNSITPDFTNLSLNNTTFTSHGHPAQNTEAPFTAPQASQSPDPESVSTEENAVQSPYEYEQFEVPGSFPEQSSTSTTFYNDHTNEAEKWPIQASSYSHYTNDSENWSNQAQHDSNGFKETGDQDEQLYTSDNIPLNFDMDKPTQAQLDEQAAIHNSILTRVLEHNPGSSPESSPTSDKLVVPVRTGCPNCSRSYSLLRRDNGKLENGVLSEGEHSFGTWGCPNCSTVYDTPRRNVVEKSGDGSARPDDQDRNDGHDENNGHVQSSPDTSFEGGVDVTEYSVESGISGNTSTTAEDGESGTLYDQSTTAEDD